MSAKCRYISGLGRARRGVLPLCIAGSGPRGFCFQAEQKPAEDRLRSVSGEWYGDAARRQPLDYSRVAAWSVYFAALVRRAGRLRGDRPLALWGTALGGRLVAPVASPQPFRLHSFPRRRSRSGWEETEAPSSARSCCTRAGETLSAAARSARDFGPSASSSRSSLTRSAVDLLASRRRRGRAELALRAELFVPWRLRVRAVAARPVVVPADGVAGLPPSRAEIACVSVRSSAASRAICPRTAASCASRSLRAAASTSSVFVCLEAIGSFGRVKQNRSYAGFQALPDPSRSRTLSIDGVFGVGDVWSQDVRGVCWRAPGRRVTGSGRLLAGARDFRAPPKRNHRKASGLPERVAAASSYGEPIPPAASR